MPKKLTPEQHYSRVFDRGVRRQNLSKKQRQERKEYKAHMVRLVMKTKAMEDLRNKNSLAYHSKIIPLSKLGKFDQELRRGCLKQMHDILLEAKITSPNDIRFPKRKATSPKHQTQHQIKKEQKPV